MLIKFTKTSVSLLLLSLSLSAGAIDQVGFSDGILKNRDKAQARKLTFLPQYIEERFRFCHLTYPAPHDQSDCLTELLNFSNEVLECTDRQDFRDQMASYDAHLFSDMVQQNGAVSIPKEVIDRILLIQKSAIKLRPYAGSIPWTYSAYKSGVLNAHAGANAHVMLSAGLWGAESPLNIDDITAIISHEISHVLEDHSLKLGCLALEWSGRSMDLETALLVFREDFSVYTDRGIAWTTLSQKFEYQADEISIELLKTSGLDPGLMGKALTKMKPKNPGGFSSGSHPEMDERIEAAYKKAASIR